MDMKGSFLSWRLTMAETLGACFTVGSTVAVIMLWANSNFQSKEDAIKMDTRITSIEVRLDKLGDGITDIAKDVSYIRGKLEPQNGGR